VEQRYAIISSDARREARPYLLLSVSQDEFSRSRLYTSARCLSCLGSACSLPSHPTPHRWQSIPPAAVTVPN